MRGAVLPHALRSMRATRYALHEKWYRSRMAAIANFVPGGTLSSGHTCRSAFICLVDYISSLRHAFRVARSERPFGSMPFRPSRASYMRSYASAGRPIFRQMAADQKSLHPAIVKRGEASKHARGEYALCSGAIGNTRSATKDFERHVDYIHYIRSARSGTRVSDWPHSSFHAMCGLACCRGLGGVAVDTRRSFGERRGS